MTSCSPEDQGLKGTNVVFDKRRLLGISFLLKMGSEIHINVSDRFDLQYSAIFTPLRASMGLSTRCINEINTASHITYEFHIVN